MCDIWNAWCTRREQKRLVQALYGEAGNNDQTCLFEMLAFRIVRNRRNTSWETKTQIMEETVLILQSLEKAKKWRKRAGGIGQSWQWPDADLDQRSSCTDTTDPTCSAFKNCSTGVQLDEKSVHRIGGNGWDKHSFCALLMHNHSSSSYFILFISFNKI